MKMMPPASDSPVEATAWVALFSRTVSRPKSQRPTEPRKRGGGRPSTPRRTDIERMAEGIDALTVRPIFRPA